MYSKFLPINKQDMTDSGKEQLDFVVLSGDAYVDHPSFGHAVIGRLVESQGFSVGIIAQPVKKLDYFVFGAPKHAFFVASGVVDSMVNNYTVAKKKRSEDTYSEGGKFGSRPDRALTTYCKYLRKNFPNTPIIVGGIEASLRRFSHYDYWSDSVMNSILVDTGADLLVYGMGERPVLDLLEYAKKNIPLNKVKDVKGTAYLTTMGDARANVSKAITNTFTEEFIVIPSHNDVSADKKLYCKAFVQTTSNTDSINGKGLIQRQEQDLYVVQNAPQKLLSEKEMDFVYSLPFVRKAHPVYKAGVPALEEVEFSITSHRGCFGNCSFCALTFHQGKAIQARSCQSIVDEAEMLTKSPDFKGYIHDVGGPTANFRNPSCETQKTHGMCKDKNCIGYKPCANLKVDHTDYLNILRSVRKIPKIKKVFVRSGIRFDYLLLDKDPVFFDELVKYHISGQLKVAPEHCNDNVLRALNKPPHRVYEDFCAKFESSTKKAGLDQYIVPYFISSHPECSLSHAIELAEFLHSINYMPKQVQDFYPTPSTLSTTMYYTELNPYTLKPVYVAKTDEDKAMQRALLQYKLKNNHRLVTMALVKGKRTDLIGVGTNCLIRNFEKSVVAKDNFSQQRQAQSSSKAHYTTKTNKSSNSYKHK